MIHKRAKRAVQIGLLVLFLLMVTGSTIAMGWGWWDEDTTEIVAFLQSHSQWLHQGNFLVSTIREIGILLLKGIYGIATAMEGLLNQSLNLIDFIFDSGLSDLANSIVNGLVLALMTLTIVWLGIKIIVAKSPPNFKSMGVNIMVSALLIVGMPTLLSTLADLSVTFYDDVQQTNQNSGLAWTTVSDNMVDLVYVAQHGFSLIEDNTSTTEPRHALTPDTFLSADLSSILTTSSINGADVSNDEFDYLAYYLVLDEQGQYEAVKFSSGFFSIFTDTFESGYFRYPMNYWTILLALLSLVVAYIFTLFVFLRTIIEIGFKRILGLFVFATDLETGERTKMVVKDILNGFLLFAFTGLSFRVYELFVSYLGSVNVNVVIYLVGMLSATFVLIKGSSTIMRYFGIDAGLNDGLAGMLGQAALNRFVYGRRGKTSPSKHKMGHENGGEEDTGEGGDADSGGNPTAPTHDPSGGKTQTDHQAVPPPTANMPGGVQPVSADSDQTGANVENHTPEQQERGDQPISSADSHGPIPQQTPPAYGAGNDHAAQSTEAEQPGVVVPPISPAVAPESVSAPEQTQTDNRTPVSGTVPDAVEPVSQPVSPSGSSATAPTLSQEQSAGGRQPTALQADTPAVSREASPYVGTSTSVAAAPSQNEGRSLGENPPVETASPVESSPADSGHGQAKGTADSVKTANRQPIPDNNEGAQLGDPPPADTTSPLGGSSEPTIPPATQPISREPGISINDDVPGGTQRIDQEPLGASGTEDPPASTQRILREGETAPNPNTETTIQTVRQESVPGVDSPVEDLTRRVIQQNTGDSAPAVQDQTQRITTEIRQDTVTPTSGRQQIRQRMDHSAEISSISRRPPEVGKELDS